MFWHHSEKTWCSVLYGQGHWERCYSSNWKTLLKHTNKRLKQINKERGTA